VRAAEYGVGAEKAQRYPAIALNANYGGAGVNVGSFNSVYGRGLDYLHPIFTGGRFVRHRRAKLISRADGPSMKI